MSASHPKATESLRSSETTLSAITGCEQMQQLMRLFDHLVGEGEQPVWNGKSQRLGRLEVDHPLEPRQLLDRQVVRLFAFENLAAVAADRTVRIYNVGSTAHEAARDGLLSQFIDRRNGKLCCQRRDLISPTVEERSFAVEPSDAHLRHCCKRRIDIAFAADFQDKDFSPENAGRRIDLSDHGLSKREITKSYLIGACTGRSLGFSPLRMRST